MRLVIQLFCWLRIKRDGQVDMRDTWIYRWRTYVCTRSDLIIDKVRVGSGVESHNEYQCIRIDLASTSHHIIPNVTDYNTLDDIDSFQCLYT